MNRDLEREHLLELLGDHVEPARRAGAGGDEGVVEIGRQQGMQRAAAIRIDADSVAVQPLGPQCVAFEHLHVDTCPDQTVGQCQAAGTGANDEYAW